MNTDTSSQRQELETFGDVPYVLDGRRGVAFSVLSGTNRIECVVTIATLQTYFWLQPDAGDARILRTFHDGFQRIHAVAQRKSLRAQHGERVEITPADFAKLSGR